MSIAQEKLSKSTATPDPKSAPPAIDPTALAGTQNSLGAESVRDGRPATSDDIVEAMDEESPAINEAA